MERKAFLDQEAPAGYVAGVGRGAVGFTTSADTARAADSDDEGPVEEAGLLAGEDHEADRIYAEVEARLARRKAKEGSSGAVAAPGAATGAAAGAVADAAGATPFVNLKRALATVSDDQWANLPTVGDLTRRNKRTRLLEQQQQRFYAAPDTALAGTNFEVIADAKDKLLSQHLDGMAPAAPAAPAVDAASYDAAPEVADVAKSRLILASLRRSDPNNASAWIAAARLEEQDHKPAAARALATQGCRAVPRAPEVWLESIRLHQPQGTRQCQAICAEALKYNPQSEQLWLRAADLEHSADRVAQRKVLMRALEHVPSSAAIWRRLIEMEEEPQRLLAKAIELCPDEWSFWLSLINLSPYAEARALLNRARQTVRSPQVWVAAAKVEEREHASAAKVAAIVERGAAELDEPRHQWLELAVEAEREGFPMTCAAVVRTACESDPSDLLKLAAQYKQHPQTARAIFQVIIDADPSSLTSWLELLGSLRAQRAEVLYDYYEQALALNEEVIWLMYAKDLWKVAGDAERAAKVLERATAAFNTEQVWFARLKLAAYTARGLWIDAVMPLSRQMFTQLPASPAAWYKHIHHLRCWRLHHDTNESVLDLCDAALERFPECAKLHLQRAQVAPESATATLAVAVRSCPSDALWIAYAESVASAVRARAILDNALAQQSSARLWLHRIRFERRHSEAAARQLCARALKQFASDASLWVEHLHLMATPAQRRNAYLDALKSTNNAALVLMHIGLFFWTDGKLAKVGAWLQRALDANDRNGDCWAWMWVHLKAHGDDGERQHFLGRFKAVYEDINEGETWTRLAKSPARTAFANSTAFLDSVADALTNT